ncbi:hypothetical protein BJ956_000560 [Arthrobacter psychrochitiniphilus]|nr:hypothetical protein [Arthrobacter psychrochitiniphilus]
MAGLWRVKLKMTPKRSHFQTQEPLDSGLSGPPIRFELMTPAVDAITYFDLSKATLTLY